MGQFMSGFVADLKYLNLSLASSFWHLIFPQLVRHSRAANTATERSDFPLKGLCSTIQHEIKQMHKVCRQDKKVVTHEV